MNRFSAVIFDLDGTLADSLHDIADAMNQTLTHFNYPIYPYEDYKYFVGNGLRNLVTQCLPEGKNSEKEIDEALSVMMKNYGENYVSKTKLYPGISELLDELTARGYKMAVLSNKADELTQRICEVLLSKWKFEMILGANDMYPRKPAPDAALFIAKKMGISSWKFLYLGDTNVDMKTADAAGMYAVGVTWGFRTRKELEENGARVIIDQPADLLKVI